MKKFLISIFCVLCFIIPTLSSVSIGVVYADEPEIQVDAKASILIDYNSGNVLFEQDADEKVQVASIVKLMTTLLTFEEIEKGHLTLEEKINATENASGMGGSQVFIDPYVEYTVEEMLKSVIVASANDASVALAEKISGSEESFVKKMNARAKELGMINTIYANASGLPDVEEYSTARDTAILLKEVLKHKDYFKYSTIWIDKLTHPSGRETEVVNTNKLLRYFKGCDSGKTGSTDEAGYCLAASAERGDMRLIAVVLGAKTGTERFNETSKVLNFGFSNFENRQIISASEPIREVEIFKSKIKTAPVYASEDFFAVTRKGENTNFETIIELNEKIKAPLASGESVGSILVTKDGVVIKEISITVSQDIPKVTYGDSFKTIISKW